LKPVQQGAGGRVIIATAALLLENRVPLYMVVEHFGNGDAVPVYRRFTEHGRVAPEGLTYISSWVDEKLATRYQVMSADDRSLLDEWMAHWADLVEFEVHAVMTSAEAAQRMLPKLQA
jgi:hypothetical protein